MNQSNLINEAPMIKMKSKLLSAKLPNAPVTVPVANYIELKANSGKSAKLAELLAIAAKIVNKAEPTTTYWIALQLNDDTFAIFDAFSNEEDQKAHVTGKVVMTLQEQGDPLIQGGWIKGILSHAQTFKVVTNV